jgi:hypothetical protein
MTKRQGCALALGATVLAGLVGLACSSNDANGPGAGDDGGTDGGADVVAPVVDAGGRGSDASAAAMRTIGPAGGTLTAGDVTLTFPPGALAGNTTITVAASTAQVPPGYTALTAVLTLGPAGTTLHMPATLELTLASPPSNAAIFLSNGSGGFDALPTTTTASSITASISHLGDCFGGTPRVEPDAGDAGDADGARAQDSAPGDGAPAVDSSTAETGPDTEAGAMDAATSDAAPPDAGPLGITATIDGVLTAFTFNASAVDLNGTWRMQADDGATTTHWTLQIDVTTTSPQQVCSTSTAYPSLSYTHYTAGVADSVYSTTQTQGYCTLAAFAPTTHGTYAHGTFSGGLDRAVDAGGGVHLISSGSYDILY